MQDTGIVKIIKPKEKLKWVGELMQAKLFNKHMRMSTHISTQSFPEIQ